MPYNPRQVAQADISHHTCSINNGMLMAEINVNLVRWRCPTKTLKSLNIRHRFTDAISDVD